MDEILMARQDRIDWVKAPVQLHHKANKVYRNRVVVLSSESVMLLKEYLKRRKNNRHQYIFSGYRNRVNTPLDRPISRNCAWEYFRRVLAKLGMTQKYDRFHYFYRPSGFRVMNLDILKSNGFPPDWAEYLVGHSISFQASYLPSTSSLSKAWLKLDSQFCFLSPNSPIVLHEKDDLTPQNGSKPDRQRRVEEDVVPSEGYRFS